MNELSLPGFQRAIKAIHGAHSRFVKRVHVVSGSRTDPLWEGDVLVFDLLDHPRASRCYTWESDGEVTTVLHDPVVDSPEESIRVMLSEWLPPPIAAADRSPAALLTRLARRAARYLSGASLNRKLGSF